MERWSRVGGVGGGGLRWGGGVGWKWEKIKINEISRKINFQSGEKGNNLHYFFITKYYAM